MSYDEIYYQRSKDEQKKKMNMCKDCGNVFSSTVNKQYLKGEKNDVW